MSTDAQRDYRESVSFARGFLIAATASTVLFWAPVTAGITYLLNN